MTCRCRLHDHHRVRSKFLALVVLFTAQIATAFTPASTPHLLHVVQGSKYKHASPLFKDTRSRLRALPGLAASLDLPGNLIPGIGKATSSVFKMPRLENPMTQEAADARALREAQARMERDAAHSSRLALSLYFQNHEIAKRGFADAERVRVASRISRSCPAPSERRGFFMGHGCTAAGCEIDLDSPMPAQPDHSPGRHVSAMVEAISARIGAGASVERVRREVEEASARAAARAQCSFSLVADVGHALEVLGVAHRMDHTVHEEKRFRDVLIERPEDAPGTRRGVVVQLMGWESFVLGRDEPNAYVEAKRRSLKKGGWAVVQVSEPKWVALGAGQLEWLAEQLAAAGVWGAQPSDL